MAPRRSSSSASFASNSVTVRAWMRIALPRRSGHVRWAVYPSPWPASTALMLHSLCRTLIRANSAAGVLLMLGYPSWWPAACRAPPAVQRQHRRHPSASKSALREPFFTARCPKMAHHETHDPPRALVARKPPRAPIPPPLCATAGRGPAISSPPSSSPTCAASTPSPASGSTAGTCSAANTPTFVGRSVSGRPPRRWVEPSPVPRP